MQFNVELHFYIQGVMLLKKLKVRKFQVLNNDNYDFLKSVCSKTGYEWNELYYINANKYYTCLQMFEFMENSTYGFLNRIISYENVLVTVDFEHLDNVSYASKFDKIIEKNENEQSNSRKFKNYKVTRKAIKDMNDFDNEITMNKDSVKYMTVRVYVYDDSLEKLQDRMNEVINLLARDKLRGFVQTNNLISDVRALTSYSNPVSKMVSSSTIADILMRSEVNKIDENVALIGYTRNGLYAPNYFSFENASYNKIFIGGMGSGKSALAKSINESMELRGNHVTHILDIHNEYDEFARQLDFSHLSINEKKTINFMQIFYVEDIENGIITKNDVQNKIDVNIETIRSVNNINDERVIKQFKKLANSLYDDYIGKSIHDIKNEDWFLLEDVLEKLIENKKNGLYEDIALENIYELELSLEDMVDSYGHIFNRKTTIDFDLTKSIVFDISSFRDSNKKVKSSFVSLMLDYISSAVYLNLKRNIQMMKEKNINAYELKEPLITHEVIIDETMQYTNDRGFLTKVLDLLKFQRKAYSGSTFIIHATDDVNKSLNENGDLLSQLFELSTNKFIGYTTGKSLETLPTLIPQLTKMDCKIISNFSKGKNGERTFFVFDDKKRKIVMTSIVNNFQKNYFKGGV